MADDVYEVRLGFNRRNLRLLATAAVLLAGGFLPGVPTFIRVLDVGLFGLGGLVVLFSLARSRLVLRVDWAGITLGAKSLLSSEVEAVIPWADMVGIELWCAINVAADGRKMPYVSVLRRPDAPKLPGRSGGRIANALSEGLAQVSIEQLNSSVPVNLWRLDRARFLGTVQRYAPALPIAISRDFPK